MSRSLNFTNKKGGRIVLTIYEDGEADAVREWATSVPDKKIMVPISAGYWGAGPEWYLSEGRVISVEGSADHFQTHFLAFLCYIGDKFLPMCCIPGSPPVPPQLSEADEARQMLGKTIRLPIFSDPRIPLLFFVAISTMDLKVELPESVLRTFQN